MNDYKIRFEEGRTLNRRNAERYKGVTGLYFIYNTDTGDSDMKYILYLFLMTGNDTELTSQEFNSLNACESARDAIIENIKAVPGMQVGGYVMRGYCIAKGED